MNILVTGGAGYIGTHTTVELLAHGHTVIAVDNLINSNKESLERVKKISGVEDIPFYEVDCTNLTTLSSVFDAYDIDAVLHFAALKAVGESVHDPLRYYRNNLDSTLILCEVMQKHKVKKLLFSSTATVYGQPEELPLRETTQTGIGISNPYGRSKYMIEQILADLCLADPEFTVTVLRYFNPVGAHESGLIGEDPLGPPNNLLPFVAQTAVGKHEKVMVFGNDYDTPDGTGLRDYIHVVDLAKGHVAALEHMGKTGENPTIYNLGTGKGASVLEVLHAFERACGKPVPYEIVARRPGDLDASYADCSKANKELGWKAEKTIEDACKDAWRWQSKNPNGYLS